MTARIDGPDGVGCYAAYWTEEGVEKQRHGFATYNAARYFLRSRRSPEPPEIMRYFDTGHLPAHLKPASQPFHDLAHSLLRLPDNGERAVALRKLLEAKDAAVRAALPPKQG